MRFPTSTWHAGLRGEEEEEEEEDRKKEILTPSGATPAPCSSPWRPVLGRTLRAAFLRRARTVMTSFSAAYRHPRQWNTTKKDPQPHHTRIIIHHSPFARMSCCMLPVSYRQGMRRMASRRGDAIRARLGRENHWDHFHTSIVCAANWIGP
jgi:hypothetical protein